MRWLMLAVHQRSITEASRSGLTELPMSERVSPEASLFGRVSGGNSWKRMRVGSATPEPKVNTSRVPSEGMNDNKLAAASDTAERIKPWSRSLASRMTKNVEHCEMMVGSISAGRCVTRPRNTPYLGPSLAVRESARRVGPKPTFLSAGA